MKVYSACDIGLVRPENQDHLITEKFDDGFLVIVCDGMGGMEKGAEASRIAVNAALETFRAKYKAEMTSDAICELLRDATNEANQAVYEEAVKGEMRIRMGTTLVGAYVREDLACLVNVGDSRAYLIETEGEAKQLTLDHTVVQMLYERGDITAEERMTHPRRNELTRAVGVTARVLSDSYELQLLPHDRLLFCSDGLYSLVPTDKMAEIVRSHPLEEVPQALVAEANAQGGKDNISVIVLAKD